MSQPDNYRDVRAYSQSSLKLLDWNPLKFMYDEHRWVQGYTDTRPENKPTDGMTLGSLVDILLTRPDDLDKEYVVINDAPTGQMKVFIDSYFALVKPYIESKSGYGEDVNNKLIAEAYGIAEFKRDKLDTVLARFKTEGLAYYNALLKTIGKTVVSADMMSHAKALVKQLEEDEFTGPILKLPIPTGEEGSWVFDVYNQLAIYWEEHGLKFKALLDKVIVNHAMKTVQPYDIKTTGDSNFANAFGLYRYDIQGAFYTDALHHWMLEQGIQDYEIKPFIFIVAFTNEKGIAPQLWSMGQYDYYAGRHGIDRPKLKKVRGYQAIINDLLWHIKEDKWKYPKEVYMKNGVRELNYYIDGISKY